MKQRVLYWGCLLITGMKSYGQGRCRNGLIRLVCHGSREQCSLNRGVGEGRAAHNGAEDSLVMLIYGHCWILMDASTQE